MTAEKLAALHESGAWTDEKAAQIETYVRPHLESVLNVADSDDSTLLAALDNLARAYTQVRPLL